MIKYLLARKLWLLISVMLMVGVSCKSKKAQHQSPAPTIEYPRPASDSNLDSLKKSLDEERARKLLEKKTE